MPVLVARLIFLVSPNNRLIKNSYLLTQLQNYGDSLLNALNYYPHPNPPREGEGGRSHALTLKFQYSNNSEPSGLILSLSKDEAVVFSWLQFDKLTVSAHHEGMSI